MQGVAERPATSLRLRRGETRLGREPHHRAPGVPRARQTLKGATTLGITLSVVSRGTAHEPTRQRWTSARPDSREDPAQLTEGCGGRTRHVRGGAARVAAAVARTRFPHHRTARLQATARAVRKSCTPGDAVKQLNFVVEGGELVRINEGGIPIARLASTEEAELYALVDELRGELAWARAPSARSKSQLRRFQALGAEQFKCEFCGTVVNITTVLQP